MAALEKSAELDRFLVKAITETKTPAMNKFAELAARSASIRKDMNERADALAKRLDAIPTLADTAFTKHEQLLDDHERGIQSLEDSLRDLAGHNGAPLEDTSKPSIGLAANTMFVAPESDQA
jgi:hypothetical protein